MSNSKKYYVKGYDMISLMNAKRSNEKMTIIEDDSDEIDDDATALFGLSVGVFVVILLINIVIWVWALMSLLKRQKSSNPLPTTALVFAILGLVGVFVPGGPILTLILVYAVN